MPSFQRCDKEHPEVLKLADALLNEFESHKPLLDAKVKICFMMAWPCEDGDGNPIEDAITKGGMKCLGLTRKNALRHRKEGLADATITLDGPYWDSSEEPERRSLLDHELHNISVVADGENTEGQAIYKRDNAGRPVIKLRKHSHEFGWFDVVAARHGAHSQERIQAARIVEVAGQFFFPQFVATSGRFSNLEVPDKGGTVTIKAGSQEVTMSHDQFTKAANKITSDSRGSNLEFDADGDRLSTTIQNAMGTISGAIAKAKK